MVTVYERLWPGFGLRTFPHPTAVMPVRLTPPIEPGRQQVPLPSSHCARLPSLMNSGVAMSAPSMLTRSKRTEEILAPSIEIREMAALRAKRSRTSRNVKFHMSTSVALPNWTALSQVEPIVLLRTNTSNDGKRSRPSLEIVLRQSASSEPSMRLSSIRTRRQLTCHWGYNQRLSG
eukprot:2220939-Prymnesium_polylepis.1